MGITCDESPCGVWYIYIYIMLWVDNTYYDVLGLRMQIYIYEHMDYYKYDV